MHFVSLCCASGAAMQQLAAAKIIWHKGREGMKNGGSYRF